MGMKKNLTIEELDELQRSKYLPLTIILVIIMFIGIVGNILVLIIYKRKFTRSSARCYILSLAIADLCVSVVGIPYHVLDLTLILTYTHTNVCKILSFLIGACTLSSVFILLVVGLDRYFKVCRPLKKQIKDFGDKKACLLASFVAIVISIPHGIIYGESTVLTQVNNLTGVECFISDGYQGSELAVGYLGFNMLVFVMSVIFLIVIYGFICRKIYHHDSSSMEIKLKKTKTFCFCCKVQGEDDECAGANGTSVKGKKDPDVDESETDSQSVVKEPESENTDGELLKPKLSDVNNASVSRGAGRNSCAMVRHVRPGSKAVEKNTMKITLMMLTITIVFIISYLPFIVISILDSTDETFWANRSITESVFLDFLLRLYLVNNVANPIIYSFWDHRFRKETKLLLKKLACCIKWDKSRGDDSIMNGNSALATSVGFSKCTEAVTVK